MPRNDIDGQGAPPSFAGTTSPNPHECVRLLHTLSEKWFYITEYLYGFALDFDGVIEAWCEGFSIHGRAGDCAHLWVGDDLDTGGLHCSGGGASGPVRMVAEKFVGTSHGDLQSVVRATTDSFEWRVGPADAEIVIARINATGIYFNVNGAMKKAVLES